MDHFLYETIQAKKEISPCAFTKSKLLLFSNSFLRKHLMNNLCCFSGKIYNYKINSEDSQLFITTKHKFTNLNDLIEFYKKNSAGKNCDWIENF